VRKTAKLEELHFRDLRHFFISHARDALGKAGLPSAVSKQLTGHTDDRTHDLYTHAIPGTELTVSQALEAAFGDTDASEGRYSVVIPAAESRSLRYAGKPCFQGFL
jgi:hypothetical protein